MASGPPAPPPVAPAVGPGAGWVAAGVDFEYLQPVVPPRVRTSIPTNTAILISIVLEMNGVGKLGI